MHKFRRRRRRRRDLTVPEVSLTPLIDTALTLLIIFMVTTPMMNNAIKVNLPGGKTQEGGKNKQKFVVYIDKGEQLFFNKIPVSEQRLIEEIKREVGSSDDQTVFVKADKAVSYGYVIKVVDHIKVVGGVRYVALATKKQA